jgi:cytochrome c553
MSNIENVMADTIDTSGQAAYEQCGYCHEYDGNTRMPNFPRLAGQWPAYIKKQLQDFRAGRRSGQMTATAELLNDQAIDEVVDYFSAQVPRPLDMPAQDDTARALAEQLYFKGDIQRGITACITCHGEHGHGIGAIPAVAGQQPDYLDKELKAFRSRQRSNDSSGQMRQVTAAMTDGDIAALAHYLAALPPRQAHLTGSGVGK